jgi:chromosome segregation ATPase
MLLTAQPLMERADETIGQLDKHLTDSENARKQLDEKVVEIASQIERANLAGTRAAKEGKNVQDAAQAAAQVTQELGTVQEQATRNIVSLQEYLAKTSAWLTRMESFTTTVSSAEQTTDKLAAIVASGTSLVHDIPVLLESAKHQQASLEEISDSMKGFVEIHDKARRDATEASERMSEYLQTFHESLQNSKGDLSEYQRCVGALKAELQHVTDRDDAAQSVATQVQTVVNNAQQQSENLERVCVAVRKVFSDCRSQFECKEPGPGVEHL